MSTDQAFPQKYDGSGWYLGQSRHLVPPAKPNTSSTCLAHLEHVERFKLNVPALVPQEVHHHLQVRFRADISRHDGVIGTVEQDLAEQFERLSLRDVVGGKD